MYADDTVLIAETPEGIQTMLNSLYSYSNDWNLTVITDKTKIVVFKNGGQIRDNEKWNPSVVVHIKARTFSKIAKRFNGTY